MLGKGNKKKQDIDLSSEERLAEGIAAGQGSEVVFLIDAGASESKDGTLESCI